MTTTTTIAVPESVLRRLLTRIYSEGERLREYAPPEDWDHAAIAESDSNLVEMVEGILYLLLDDERCQPGEPNPLVPWYDPVDDDFPVDMVEDMRISRAEIRALRKP